MSILLINQFFWPDTAATGNLLSDVADHLARNGESVDVICSSAQYGGTTRSSRPNVKILRLRNPQFSRRFAGRMGSYLSFLLGAFWHAFRVNPPETVVTLTTPPLLSLVGLALQKLRGSQHVIWEMDVYPDVAVDLGVLKANSLAARVFGWLADYPRRRADKIIVLGECMKRRLLAHGIPEEKIFIAENWAENPGRYFNEVSEGPLAVIYSGNFGMVHDAETVAHAAVELRDGGDDVRFVFAGGGSKQAWLRDFCQRHGLQDVEFPPYCESHELAARLEAGHMGLVTQKTECLGSSVPSKTYAIMAAGRPVLFVGPREATTAQTIERFGCGWQIDCGDSHGLAELLRRLDSRRDLIEDAGRRARKAFLTHHQRSIGVARVAGILRGVEAESEMPMVARVAVG